MFLVPEMSSTFQQIFNCYFNMFSILSSQALSLYVDDGIPSNLRGNFSLGLNWFIDERKAPDQNRTDTSSLEGYGSTIELQALVIPNPYTQRDGFIPRDIVIFFVKRWL